MGHYGVTVVAVTKRKKAFALQDMDKKGHVHERRDQSEEKT